MVDPIRDLTQDQLPRREATDVLGNVLPSQMVRPDQQGVDVLGNVLPKGMVDTAAEPVGRIPGMETLRRPDVAPVSGGATLAQILSSRGQVLSQSMFGRKLGQSVTDAVKANPEVARQPGGTMRAIVGGALDALRGTAEAFGDVAAVGVVPPGAGALTGIARTAQARGQRERQARLDRQAADRNKVLMAEANVRMLHEQRLVHKLDEASIKESIESGVQTVNKLKTSPAPAPILAEGLTSEELMEYLANNKLDPSQETAFPTGRKVIGLDKSGNPVYRTTYTAIGVPSEVSLNPEDPIDKKILNDMNKYAPQKEYKWGEAGVQTMSGQQYNMIMQQVSDTRAAEMARRKAITDLGYTERDIERSEESIAFGRDPRVINALANAKGNLIAARNAILENPEMQARYPNIDNNMREWVGTDKKTGKNPYDEMLIDYQKKLDEGTRELNEVEKKISTMHGEEAAATAAGLQIRLDDPSTPVEERSRLIKLRNEALARAQESRKYQTELLGEKAEKEKEVLLREIVPAAEAIASGDLTDFKDITTSFKGNQRLLLYNQVKKINPDFDLAGLKRKIKLMDLYTTGSEGRQLQSFGTFLQHAGETYDASKNMGLTLGIKFLNRPIAVLKEEISSNPDFKAFMTSLEPVRKEFEGFLLGGRALYAEDRKAAQEILDDSSTPAQVEAALRQMGRTVKVRYDEMGHRFRGTMKRSMEEVLDPISPEALENAKKIGIDLTKTGQQPRQIGTIRIRTPRGTIMDIPANQKDQAIANGAVIIQ